MLRQVSPDSWETIMKPGRRGKRRFFTYGDGRLHGEVIDVKDDGGRIVRFDKTGAELYNILDEIGTMPLRLILPKSLKTRLNTTLFTQNKRLRRRAYRRTTFYSRTWVK